MGIAQTRARQTPSESVVVTTPTQHSLLQLAANEVERRPKLQPHEVDSLRLASPHVYAILSAAVYDRARVAPLLIHTGWSTLMTCASCQLDREGYYAEAFVHLPSRHCIIAQRGTTDVFGLRAGVWMLFAEYTIQVALAEQFSHEVRRRLRTMSGTQHSHSRRTHGRVDSEDVERDTSTSSHTVNDDDEDEWFVSYTGHSLGALLAAHRATEEGSFAITFESPGCFTFLEKNVAQGGCSAAETNVITYLSEPNPINTLRPQCGYQLVVPIPAESLPSDALMLSAEPSRRATSPANSNSSSGVKVVNAGNGNAAGSFAPAAATSKTLNPPSNNSSNIVTSATANTTNSITVANNNTMTSSVQSDNNNNTPATSSRWMPSFSVPSISVPSIRVPSLSVPIRSYVSRCAREQMLDTVGIPELQQYFIKLEPVIREMFEQAQQEHNVRNFIVYFAQRESARQREGSSSNSNALVVQPPRSALGSCTGPQSGTPSALTTRGSNAASRPASGEAHVLRWPNNVFQFIEYYNTKRALDDPENRPAAVQAAYRALLRRIKHTEPAAEHEVDLCYIAPSAQAVVRWWGRAEAGALRGLPLTLLDHKVLNTLTIVSAKGDSNNDNDTARLRLHSEVLTVVEVKQYLARLIARPRLAPYLRQLMHEKRPSHL